MHFFLAKNKNIKNSKTEKLGREIIETIEDKQILSENCKRIFEKILKLNDKTIINQIMEFEELYIKLDEYNTELEKKISNINIEKYWKENNKELSALYDNADILLENIIKYEDVKKRKIEVVGFSETELNNRENQEILNEKKSLFDELIKLENSNELFNNVLNFEEKYIELKNSYQQTEEYLKRIDIEEIWKYENKGNEIIYDNVESIRKELLEYENIIKNKIKSIGISEECIKKEEDSELLINRTKNIFESILNSDKREELIKEVLRLEENFNLLQKYQNKANENINKINIEEIWKENNFKEKEIYDNVEKMYEKIERFNKCFFLSPQKFKLKKEILNYNKEKNITEIKESIEKVYNEKKINKHIEEIIKNNSTSVLEKLNLILEKVFLNIKDRDLLDENREELKTLQEKINSSKELISDRVDAIEEIMEEIRKKDGMFYIQLVIYKLKQSIGKYFSDEKVFNKREFIEKINLEKEVNKKMQEKLQSKELNILSKIRLIINEINILPYDKNKLKNTLENIEKLEEKTDIEKEIINKNIIESEKLIEKIKESKGLFYFDLMCYLLKKEVSKYFNENSLNNKKIIVQKVIDDKVKNIEVAKKISEIDTSILEKSEIIINNICLSSEDKEQLLTMMKNINTNNESIEKLIGSIKGKYKEIDEISNEIKKKDGMFYFNLVVYLLKSEIRKYFRDDSIDGKKLLIQNVLFEKISNKRIQENILNKEIEVLKRAEIVLKEVELNTAEKEVLAKKILNLEKIENIVESISEYFNDSFIEMLKYSENSISLNSLIETITNEFELIKIYDVKKVNFNEREKIILDNFVKNNSKNYLENLENTYYLKWIEEIEKEIGDTLLTIDDYHSLKTDAFSLIKEKRKIVPEYILNKLNEKIKSNFQFNRAGNEIYYKNLIVEANKKRKMLSLRKYIEIFIENGIFDIVPCWLLTPEVVSEILPYQKEYFDIVIFDEASQMFVEKSVPSIFRAKKVIVAGDDKQLKPSAIGVKRSEDEEEDESNEMDEEYKDDSAVTTQSLLDLAKARYNDTLLSYHYRSKYPELINFSNYAFYNGNLITAPNKEILDKPPIEVIKLKNGIWENQSNIVEAENVYKVVKELLLTREKNESIGIVTFNAKQQSTIKEYLDNICESDIEFRKIYEQEKIRYDGTEDQSLFVKNIENVQGDERDIIIFSTAYAKDIKTGRIANRFGTLSQEGGENRLNVAISRAKVKIIIITSIEPEELDIEKTKNNGPKLLKKYLQYCRAVSQKDMESAKKILESLDFIKEINQNEADKFDSPFEEEVCDKLRNNNFIVHTQVGDSGYKIDLAIYDKSTLDYILGIECDGATYHSSPSARERDIYRQKFLEMKGWNIHRIWSKHWWENPDKEIDKIIKKVNRINNSL